MCGILAVLDPFGAPARAQRHGGRADGLLDTMAHRGPDGRGILSLARGWLGHRRLAIVDPEGGAQPFVDDGTAWIANGEIFNHGSLRSRFGAAPTRSDCGVIGPLWQCTGDAAPSLVDGQFAFVCLDRAGRWIAARDHAGISPLYVGHHEDGTVWFASEMKALVDACSRVALVEPGHAWTSDERGTGCTRWYEPAWETSVPDTPADRDLLRHTLIDAVHKRMMSDVPWGVLLSGGADSSLVAAIATRLTREAGRAAPRSFSIGLQGAPDLAAARRVADFLGTDHHEFTFTIEEALALVPCAIHHLESYQQVRTAVPTMLLAQRVRATGTKMVLSGEGADELLGGYLYFHHAPSAAEFHAETVRKTLRLHQYDVMRANKAPMAHGVELRFPFLDRAFVDLVMSIDPVERMVGANGIEKAILREAFDDLDEPWLPRDVLWRQKEQFSDGVGYSWVDTLRSTAATRVRTDWAEVAVARFPEDTPPNQELFWMRELFEKAFVEGKASGRSALSTVGTGRSIACSTPEAVAWNPAWAMLAGDISGRAIASVHAGEAPLR
jgi:asparagine synthase (glutamine-hydrolysing)